MLDRLQMLYPSIPQEQLAHVLSQAKDFAQDYCSLDSYDASLDCAVMRMAQEDVNGLFAEGFKSESAEGSSVTYTGDYSDRVYKVLNRHKRIRTVRG